ncbi:MAG: M15 family metallopeptidase [Bacteroidales bacterium]|nr:M15 family metallopeptidase [Bacteroidales bacterium]
MKKRIEFVQEELKKRGLYSGEVDGVAGSGTESALNKITGLEKSWNISRKIHGFIQLLCQENGISPGDIDGYWGSQTEYALNQYLYLKENGQLPDPWRPEERSPVNPNNWPVQYTAGFDAFYGPKGSSLVKLQLPYTHRLSWDLQTSVNSFSCHQKVHDSMKRVLTNVFNYYGPDKIRELRLDSWGGCYNERPIRGGTKWSMHSWGIAVDFDPGRNKLDWGRDKASFAQPVYNKWWQFWEDEGWVSLGRERNFDWMHVQAAKL